MWQTGIKRGRLRQTCSFSPSFFRVSCRIEFKNVNLTHVMLDSVFTRGASLSALCDGRSDDWCRQAPPYTLYATAPPSLFKYLTQRSLRRDSFLSEFYRGRPEFFFVVTHRTLRDLTATNGPNNRLTPLNALFQVWRIIFLATHYVI